MLKMAKRYQVEVSASNTTNKEFNTIKEVKNYLKKCNGTVSVLDLTKSYGWQEIYLGPADRFERPFDKE